jgi:hypothetical protein
MMSMGTTMLLVDGSQRASRDATIEVTARPVSSRPLRWRALALGFLSVVLLGVAGQRPVPLDERMAESAPSPAQRTAVLGRSRPMVIVSSVKASPGHVTVRGTAMVAGVVRIQVLAGVLSVTEWSAVVDQGAFVVQLPTDVGSQGIVAEVRVSAPGTEVKAEVVARGQAYRTSVDPATGMTVHVRASTGELAARAGGE